MSRGWLIVFAKAPRAGLVKTRMCPPLSLEEAARLYDAMLADVLEASGRFAAQLDLHPILAFHPPDGVGELLARTPPGYRLQVQRGASLGERMANAFAEAAAAGVHRILLRGSDSPEMTFSHVETALARLDAGADVVVTPDQSGGYAMIGMSSPHPLVFTPPMSTDDVFVQTLAIARGEGLVTATTEKCSDLDTVHDLLSLRASSESEPSDSCLRTVESIRTLTIGHVL